MIRQLKWISLFFVVSMNLSSFGQGLPIKLTQNNYLWMNVGAPDFTSGGTYSIDLKFSPTGEPYIVYPDWSTFSRAEVKKFDGTGWVDIGTNPISGYKSNYLTIAFDAIGQIYVGFEEDAWRGTVMKFDGSVWNPVGTTLFTEGDVAYCSIAVNPNGQPYFAFQDKSFTGWGRASVMRYNDTSWVYVGQPGFSIDNALFINLVFNQNAEPVIAYSDVAQDYKVTVMKFDGVNWVGVGPSGFSANEANFISLTLDSDDQPVVAYIDASQQGKISVMKYDGTNWAYLGSPGINGQNTVALSLAYNAFDGHLYLACSDKDNFTRAKLLKFDGTNWNYVGGNGFSPDSTRNVCLAINPGGVPYVAFTDGSAFWNVTVMKYDSLSTGIPSEKKTYCSINPNPARERFCIDFHSLKQFMKEIKLYSNVGTLIMTKTTCDNIQIIDVSGIPAGVYYIQIRSGSENYDSRIVIL
jgi:hypothetical protein